MASTGFCEQPSDYVSKVLSEKRKAKKPLMEKMRRARINDSLNELKALILQALNKDASRYSKMEKADVLEMTVNYLREIRRREQKQQDGCGVIECRAGFVHCAAEISRKMIATDMNDELRANFLAHLASRCQGNSASGAVASSVVPVLKTERMQYTAPLTPVLIPYPSPPPSPRHLSSVSTSPATPTRSQAEFASTPEPTIGKPVSSAPLWRPW